MNSRARNLLWMFGTNETNYSTHGIYRAGCLSEFRGATMRFGPELSAHSYAELRGDQCCSERLSIDHVHTNLLEGLQIIMLQSRIMSFLEKCCEIILQDIETTELLASPIQEEPPVLKDLSQLQKHRTFSDAIVIAPYLRRTDLDFQRLQNYVNAAFDEMKDHVFTLREDPSYFADTFAEVSEHRPEMIPVVAHCQDIFVRCGFDGNVLTTLISDAYEGLFMWHGISTEIDRLMIHFRGSEQVKVSERLPVILDFEVLLDQARKRLLDRIISALQASPTMRNNYVRMGVLDKNDKKFLVSIMEEPITPEDRDKSQILLRHLFSRLSTLEAYTMQREFQDFNYREPLRNDSIYWDIDCHTIMDYIDTLGRKTKLQGIC